METPILTPLTDMTPKNVPALTALAVMLERQLGAVLNLLEKLEQVELLHRNDEPDPIFPFTPKHIKKNSKPKQ
jgi:hypothetical protein